MKIFLESKKIRCLSDDNVEVICLDIGIDDLTNLDTHLVDIIVSDIINYISEEDVFLFSNESLIIKMIGRKIEDKIKREVHYNKVLI